MILKDILASDSLAVTLLLRLGTLQELTHPMPDRFKCRAFVMNEPAIDLMLTGSGADGLQLLLLRLMFVALCIYSFWRCLQDGTQERDEKPPQ